jgi:hypothetical protein
MTGVPVFARGDLTFIPIQDMPPIPLGLIWRTAHENARIRALAATARSINPSPPRRRGTARPQPAATRHSL